MNIIKNIRENAGFTQAELAKQSGLSLRTIQRLESSNKKPKGHTLTMVSDAFKLKLTALLKKFQSIEERTSIDKNSIQLINLSILSFIGIPFGNIIFPLILWIRNRKSEMGDEVGRRIINFQIIWWIVLAILLSISPFISRKIFYNTHIILYVLLIAYVVNVVIVCITAMKFRRDNFNFLNIPIRLL